MTLRELDHRLTCALHNQAGKYSWLDRLAVFCARDLPIVFVLIPFFLLFPHGFEKILFILTMIVSQCSALFLQRLIHRKRPFQREQLRPIYLARFPSPSFPSGHATLVSTVLIMSFAGAYPSAMGIFWSLVVMGVLILAARVYGGLHYVSDIIAGLLFAPLLLFVFSLILQWFGTIFIYPNMVL